MPDLGSCSYVPFFFKKKNNYLPPPSNYKRHTFQKEPRHNGTISEVIFHHI